MSKYIYIGDGQCKGKNPINRRGDYFADWLLKFEEVLELGKKYKVDAILDGGDLLDSPIVSYNVCDAIVDKVEKSGLNFRCLFGNHAQKYYSNELSSETTLAHILKRSKNFKYLDTITDDFKTYYIVGIDYNYSAEEQIRQDGIRWEEKSYRSLWKIAIVHAFICPKPFPYSAHIICDDIETNADLILCAHYHKPWQKKVKNTQYVDIGCFGRTSISEYEVEPSCILLDTEKRSYEIIKLQSAKKGNEIFDLDKLKEIKESDATISDFLKSIESVNFQGQRIQDIIQQLGKEQNTDQEVISIILQEIERLKI